MKPKDMLRPGTFVIGANYWASHAGTAMWRDWRPEIVEDDLRRLAEAGLQMLRVFPLWPDFQPIHLLWGGGGRPVEVRFGEEPLPDDDWGQAGLSSEMMERFRAFLDIAYKYGFLVDVGLLTGWMSGRLHIPPALEGRNVLTDPWAIRWAVRFVRQFVRAFRTHPAVAAWDLGNECNCMGPATRDEAYAWTAQIVHAIRAEDQEHPILSGMHGLSPEGPWSIFDQAELCDMLTTHPYPVFTPYCNQDPVNTIRPIFHSTAESRYYSDLGGKPCLCQELGTLGPVIASESVAEEYVRACLWTLWTHDCHGLLWWCAHDQTELAHAPYDWHAVERELGLLRVDKSPKPVLHTMQAFRATMEHILEAVACQSLEQKKEEAQPGILPPRTCEAVCLLTEGQDAWGVAYSTFILAKQAGFDVQFQHASQPLREAKLYLLPCLSGHAMIPRRRLLELLQRIQHGATLYISLDTGLPSYFEAITGLEPQSREKRAKTELITLKIFGNMPQIPGGGEFKVRFRSTRADVLGVEADGNPAFTVAEYGRGRVFFLSVPMEMMITRTPGAFHYPEAPPFWRIYRYISEDIRQERIVRKQHPFVGVTEHPCAADRRLIIGINYSSFNIQDTWSLADGWRMAEILHGEDVEQHEGWLEVHIPPLEAVALLVAYG